MPGFCCSALGDPSLVKSVGAKILTRPVNTMFRLSEDNINSQKDILVATFNDCSIFVEPGRQSLKFCTLDKKIIRTCNFHTNNLNHKMLIKGIFVWDTWEWLVFGRNTDPDLSKDLYLHITRNSGRDFTRIIVPETGIIGQKSLFCTHPKRDSKNNSIDRVSFYIGALPFKSNSSFIRLHERCRFFDPITNLSPSGLLLSQACNLNHCPTRVHKNLFKHNSLDLSMWTNYTQKSEFTICYPNSWAQSTQITGADIIYNVLDSTKMCCASIRAVKKNPRIKLSPSEILAILENDQYSYFVLKKDSQITWSDRNQIITEYTGPKGKKFNARTTVFENSMNYFVLMLVTEFDCPKPLLNEAETVFYSFRLLNISN